ncbi:MAG: hypothetical protein ACO1RX_15655 [Candidatus Sericytochromatia bacterium]
MNVGYNSNQALLAGATPASFQQMPYTPSYSVPIQTHYQAGPRPQAPTPMRTDSYESTRDKNVGDVIGGFFTGAGKSVYDMGRGLFFLGKTAGYAISHPIKTVQKVGGAVVHGVTNPMQTAEMVVTLPFKVAKGIVKPYSQALQQGKYGEALGRLAVDVTVIAASMGEKPKPLDPPGPTPTPTPVTPTPAVTPPAVTPVSTPLPVGGGGGANNVSNTIGDTILEKIGSVENITGNGNTINVNIGNINIGGGVTASPISGVAGGTVAAGTPVSSVVNNLDEVAKVVDKVDDVAQVVSSGGTQIAQASETAGTVLNAVSSQGTTIGTRIGTGIDFIVGAPGKALNAVGSGIQKLGRGIQNVGNVILNPLDTLKGMDAVKTTEWIANGIRSGGNAIANGMIYAAHNPREAAIIAGAVGRGGKAAEDILMEMDIVR